MTTTADQRLVTYEDFGATGDGITDDLPAIQAAHAYANAHGLPVRSRPDATYHLGRRALTAEIATDTDWNTSRFTIDDSDVDDHRAPIFEVCSLLPPEPLTLTRLERGQTRVDLQPTHRCHVRVERADKRVYIRRGLNRNQGVPAHDSFILHRDGTIEGAINWDYEVITDIQARPIDATRLVLRGGVFTTMANRMRQDIGYNYWNRGIQISRSNTEVVDLTHYVVGETAYGHPYRGFLAASQCADITWRNCFVSGHKTYETIGAAGKPVRMGSYDLHANDVVNLHLAGCRMNHILDRTRWGVIATNFCTNVLLQDCTLSRMDTHMGVSGQYTIRNCTLGYMGLNAIGRGLLTVQDSTLYGRTLVNLRSDYGSTWDGRVVIHNCRWVPGCGDGCQPYLVGAGNDGMHDFGYPCCMPNCIDIDGLHVDDTHHPEAYAGTYLFSNPDGMNADANTLPPVEQRPHPYTLTRQVSLRNVTAASGKPLRVSPNPRMAESTHLVADQVDVCRDADA